MEPIKNQIAFIGYKQFASDVFIYDLDNDSLEQITNDVFSDVQVSWSPDGLELLLVSDRQNNVSSVNYDYLSTINFNFDSYDIYNIDSENDISRLTNTDYNEIYPHYSPSENILHSSLMNQD